MEEEEEVAQMEVFQRNQVAKASMSRAKGHALRRKPIYHSSIR